MRGKEILEKVGLPLMFTLVGITIAYMLWLSFKPYVSPEDCLKKIADKACKEAGYNESIIIGERYVSPPNVGILVNYVCGEFYVNFTDKELKKCRVDEWNFDELFCG